LPLQTADLREKIASRFFSSSAEQGQGMGGGLTNRVAIVTGGGWNVGRAVAEAFARDGARVVVAARARERLEATATAIRAAGGVALAVPTDVTDLAAVEALVARTVAEFGTVDVLAAVAGGGAVYEPIDSMPPDAWDRIYRQNVTSLFYCTRAVLPLYRQRDSGVVLTCSGGGGFHPVLGLPMAAYACAKAAVCRFTDQLTAELWETGIRVNCFDPGLAWDAPTLARIEAEERSTGRPHPLRDRYRPASVAAELALWLASPRSEPLRGRCVSVYDDWWKDPVEVARVDATIHRYRLRRDDL